MDDELREIREKKMEELRKRFDPPKSAEYRSHGDIIIATSENFAGVVSTYPRLIVDFWAPWCGPCRMLAPVVDALAAEFSGKVQFAKCNSDENQQIAYQFGVSAIPALFFFLNGQMVHQIAGALPKPEFEKQIREIFHV
ncbi:MAG: thioredoxin [Methanobacteriota archaeon]